MFSASMVRSVPVRRVDNGRLPYRCLRPCPLHKSKRMWSASMHPSVPLRRVRTGNRPSSCFTLCPSATFNQIFSLTVLLSVLARRAASGNRHFAYLKATRWAEPTIVNWPLVTTSRSWRRKGEELPYASCGYSPKATFLQRVVCKRKMF